MRTARTEKQKKLNSGIDLWRHSSVFCVCLKCIRLRKWKLQFNPSWFSEVFSVSYRCMLLWSANKMEIYLRLYGLLCKIVNYLITPFLILVFGGSKKSERLPKIDNPILEICAVDLAEKIRNREVSASFKASNEWKKKKKWKAIKNQSQRSIKLYLRFAEFVCTGQLGH